MQNHTTPYTTQDLVDLYHLPFMDLLYQAQSIHRNHHDPNTVQVSALISIKTGGCSEDCGYCPQAARYHTGIEAHDLMSVNQVKALALRAQAAGSSRVCLGAAWRNVKDGKEFEEVLEMVRTVTKMNMEVCCTLGMITENQAKRLEEAGLYAYNHNIDTSEDYYKDVISTRAFEDRIETIDNVRKTSITLCSGGIIGMGETIEDRMSMIKTLANMTPHPESVPINALVAVEGTPLEDLPPVSSMELIRTIAVARIAMPHTQVRLSAGRKILNKEAHALCFMAGANSIFSGDKLLTTENPCYEDDMQMFNEMGIQTQKAFAKFPQREVIDIQNATVALGEKPKWTRPGHTIERNLEKSIF